MMQDVESMGVSADNFHVTGDLMIRSWMVDIRSLMRISDNWKPLNDDLFYFGPQKSVTCRHAVLGPLRVYTVKHNCLILAILLKYQAITFLRHYVSMWQKLSFNVGWSREFYSLDFSILRRYWVCNHSILRLFASSSRSRPQNAGNSGTYHAIFLILKRTAVN